MLSEKDVSRLAELARIALTPAERKSLLKDLEKILAHFEELKSVDTEGVVPMAGGSWGTNVTREDVTSGTPQVLSGVEATPVLSGVEATPVLSGVEAFPETHDGFLKIPPVFE